jgi:hypothetical protein
MLMAAINHDDLTEELDRLRNRGLIRLRGLDLPALSEAARVTTGDDSLDTPVAIEQLLRSAVARLGGGDHGDAASALLGLERGLRGASPVERREAAADALGMSSETFRTRHQKVVLSSIADQVLALVHEHEMRSTHEQLSRRHPAESRLAVEWVQRFEAYYRIWTPVFALGADLTAYRGTMLEEDRPYGGNGDVGPHGEMYTQEMQAEGYAQSAIYYYARFAWELAQFMTRHGGLWLLSDGETETAVTDAVYAIAWHITPLNERDESFLRSVLQDTRGQEMHGFLQLLGRTDIGQETYAEWLDWLGSCQCKWEGGETTEAEHFPTRTNHEGILGTCQVHRVIEACGTYCDLIDRDWRRIADWYHLDDPVRRGRSPEERYSKWRDGLLGRSEARETEQASSRTTSNSGAASTAGDRAM